MDAVIAGVNIECTAADIDKSFARIFIIIAVDAICSHCNVVSAVCDADAVLTGKTVLFSSNIVCAAG